MTPVSMPTPLSTAKAKTLLEFQSAMDGFVASRGWYEPGSEKPQLPRNLAASISLEANEVLECFQWAEDADLDAVGAELADVILYAAQLANVLGIDLGSAVEKKLTLNNQRFPAVADKPWPRRLAS
jgi:NTP pyrophosphatase (non-canonical NTP hydrolase)